MKSRTPWQRLALSLLGILAIGGTWHMAINHLYSLPPESFASFTTLTVNAQYVVGAIVIFMVTGRLVYEWKMDTAAKVIEAGEQIGQEFVDHTPSPKSVDDPDVQ
jgi:hypothetical protein